MRDAAKPKTNFWTIANSIKRYLTIIHRCRYEAVRLKSYKMKRCRKTRIKPLSCLHSRVSFTRILKKSSYFKPRTCPWRAVPAALANHIDGTEGPRYVLVCSCEVHVFRRDITKDKTRIILQCKFNHNLQSLLQSGVHLFCRDDKRKAWSQIALTYRREIHSAQVPFYYCIIEQAWTRYNRKCIVVT